jgi:hypothetical protein
VLVDEDAIIQIDAAIAEKANFRANPNSNCNNIAGYSFAAACYDAFDLCCARKLSDLFSENEINAACSEILGEEIGDLRRT